MHCCGVTDIGLYCLDLCALRIIEWGNIDRAHGSATCKQVATKVDTEKAGAARNQKKIWPQFGNYQGGSRER